MKCPVKTDLTYQQAKDIVGESVASALASSYGDDIPKSIVTKINNQHTILEADKRAEHERTPQEEHILLSQYKDYITNIQLEDEVLHPIIAKALGLLQARYESLKNMYVEEGDSEVQSKRDIQMSALRQDMKALRKEGIMDKIIISGEQMISWIEEDVINSAKMDSTSLLQAEDTLRVVSEMVKSILGDFTLDAEGEAIYKIGDEKLINKAKMLREKANLAADSLVGMKATILTKVSIDKGGRTLNINDFTTLEQTSRVKATFMDVGTVDSKLVQLVASILYDTQSNAITEFTEKVLLKIDAAEKQLKDSGIDVNDPKVIELFMQEDSKGNKTTDFVSKYTDAFTQTMSRIRWAIKKDSKYTDDEGNLSDIAKTISKIAIIPDYFSLFNENAPAEDRDKEIARIKEDLGEVEGEELLQRAAKAFKGFEQQRTMILDRYELMHRKGEGGFTTPEDVNKMYQDWIDNNSPVTFIDALLEEISNPKKKSSLVGKSMKYLVYVPSKKNYPEGYDEKYKKLSEDKTLFNYYETIIGIMKDSIKYLPSDYQDKLSDNYLPEVDKDITDGMLRGDFTNASVVLYNKLTKLVSSNSRDERSFDTGDGGKTPLLPIKFADNRVGEYRNYINKIEIDLQAKHRDLENWQTMYAKAKYNLHIFEDRMKGLEDEIAELDKQLIIAKESFTRAIENKATNMTDAVKTFAMMATMYKHRNQVKDVITIAEQTANEMSSQKTDITGEAERDKNGKIKPSRKSATETLKTMEYAIESLMYDKSKPDPKATKKLIGTNAEARQAIKEYKNKLNKTKEELFAGNITRAEYDLIEEDMYSKVMQVQGVNNLSFSRILDNLTNIAFFRGMAWGVRTAISNVAIAKIANNIEAASGEYFDDVSLKQASATMRMAVKNSLGMRNEEALKIANLMHRYGIMFRNLESAYGGAQATGEYFEKLGILAPLELQKRGEYYNQGSTLLAMLYKTKVKTKEGKEIPLYEAYDNNGILKTDVLEQEQWGSLNTALKSNDFTRLRARVQAVMRKTHGNYDKPMMAKKTALGRMAMGFKTWMPEAIASRFGDEYYSDLLGEIVKGRYISYKDTFKMKGVPGALNMMKNIIINDWMKRIDDPSYKGMTSTDIANMKRNMREVQIFLALSALTLLAYLAFEDDDDEEPNIAFKVALDLIGRAQQDITLFVNPSAMNTAVIAAPPALKWLTDVWKIFPAISKALTSDDDRYGAGDVVYKTLRVIPFGTQVTSTYRDYIKDTIEKEK